VANEFPERAILPPPLKNPLVLGGSAHLFDAVACDS
jgi:hypothetical protein